MQGSRVAWRPGGLAVVCVLLWASACAGDGAPRGAALPPPGEGEDPEATLLPPRQEDDGPTGAPEPATPGADDALDAPLNAPARPAEPSPAGSAPRAGSSGAAGGAEGCHPAYHPCLADLPGDALDCADLAEELKPVVIWDAAEDPYRLGDGTGWRGCTGAERAAGAAEPPLPGDPAEPAALPAAPPASPSAEGPPVEPIDSTALPPPAPVVSEPPAPESPAQPSPGESSAAGPAPGPSPATAPPPGEPVSPEPEALPGESESPEPEALPSERETPAPGTTGPLVPRENVAERCNPEAAAGEEQWCLPEPPAGADVVRLFWCDEEPHASADIEVYVDSDTALKYRTRPLTLAAGTRFERYSTCYGVNGVEVVTRIGRIEAPDGDGPALGVHMCGRFYLGSELFSWGETVYTAWQDPDGRLRVDMPDPVEYVGPC